VLLESFVCLLGYSFYKLKLKITLKGSFLIKVNYTGHLEILKSCILATYLTLKNTILAFGNPVILTAFETLTAAINFLTIL